MSRYIDAEAFFKVINTLPYKDTSYPDASVYNGAISDVADMLTHFPPADVLEVRHGRWNWVDGVRCSICNYKLQTTGLPSYCPNCGASMTNGTDYAGDISYTDHTDEVHNNAD